MQSLFIATKPSKFRSTLKEVEGFIGDLGGKVDGASVVYPSLLQAKEESKPFLDPVQEKIKKNLQSKQKKEDEPSVTSESNFLGFEKSVFKKASNAFLNKEESLTGTLLMASLAYNPTNKDKDNNKKSYCIVVDTSEGKKRLWGKELQSCIEIGEFSKGSRIRVKKVANFFHNKETGERKPAIFEMTSI